MVISITGIIYKQVLELLKEQEKQIQIENHRWINDEDKVKLDISDLCVESLQKIHDLLNPGLAGDAERRIVIARNLTKQWMEIKRDPSGIKVTKLTAVPGSIKEYLMKLAPNRIVFEQNEDGNSVPYLVANVEFHEANVYHSASVTIELMNIFLASESDRSGNIATKKITLDHEDVYGRIVPEILSRQGLYAETPERMASYEAEMKIYNEFRSKVGLQMNVVGKAYCSSKWSGYRFRAVERDGEPAQMVIDPPEVNQVKTTAECKFWQEKKSREAEPEARVILQIPVHPYIRLFHLTEHCNYAAHINNMSMYLYNRNLGDKLVLPKDVKELLSILVEYASCNFEDIVSGKAGGVIVLCTGVPGVGKTLTPEVYSEIMARPLYKVQASQLGINIDELEKKLSEVLQRAEKWGAILLIDEADVYVRSREKDIEQNAIVGVFLRVLEYYKGILFMTTNMGFEIDDALVSRVTARIEYRMPDKEDRMQIWKIISEQNHVAMADADLNLVAELELSGRDIKNLLKLAKMVSERRKVPVTFDLINNLLKFKQ